MKRLLLLVFCLVGVSELRADQTVTVRSGNGPIGSQDTLVRVLPKGEGDITPAPSDFTTVQSANFAWVNSPYATYIPSLPEDPNAKWIATTPNLSPQSALYAVPFQLTDSSIVSATLDIRYAVDNAINGVYINGQKISGNSFDGDYHSEFRFVRSDVASLLLPNATNWLYLNVSDYGGLAGLIFSATITTQGGGVNAITPASGGNTGNVTVRIGGQNFQGVPTTVTLRASGQPDIVGLSPQVLDASTIVTAFNLLGVTPGARDVVVSQGGIDVATLQNSFTVQAGGADAISIDIVGPSRFRAGRDATFEVVVSNSGSVDVPFVQVQAGINAAQQQVATPQLSTGSLPQVANCSLGPTILYLPAGVSRVLSLICTAQGSSCSNLGATAQKTQPSGDCSKEQQAVTDATISLENARIELNLRETELLLLQNQFLNMCFPVTASNAVACVLLQLEISQKHNEVDAAHAQVQQAQLDLLYAEAALAACLARHQGSSSSALQSNSQNTVAFNAAIPAASITGTSATLQFCGVTSVDPNDKLGTAGSGVQQYVRGSLPLSYTVLFENLPTASASAGQVVVTDKLDPALDWASVLIRSLRFGNSDIEVPQGAPSVVTVVDLRPNTSLLVSVSAQVVADTLRVSFDSIDPNTGQPPTDPTAGFLPPDLNPPAGEGSISFTVMPKHTLATGTQIKNMATVVFDTNAPISTPTWLNTVDNTKPVSSVLALPPTESSYNFTIQWSGMDVDSGIKDYTIFVSDNGGPFTILLTQTTATQTTFSGVGGHIYSFYSIARDLAGNIEDSKTNAEATTQVVIDSTPPVIVPQVSGTLGGNGWYRSDVTVSWTVTDPESGIASSKDCAPTTLTADTVGVTLTCSATNGAGLSSSVPVTIKIDTTPPIVACGASPNVLWPPNNKLVPINVSVNVSDALSEPAGFTLVSVTSNEPDSGQGDIQAFVTGTASTSGQLRATRLGSGTGRVYTFTYNGSDKAGNTASCTTTVTVPHDQGQN